MGALSETLARPFDRMTWLLLAVLLVWVGIGFAPAAWAEFVMVDDNLYVMRPEVLGGLTPDNLRWTWFETHLGYWIPLTYLSLQVDGTITQWLYGPTAMQALPGEPLPPATVFHVHNVLLHGVGAGLLFLSLVRLTGKQWAAVAAAGLWAVHPLRVESVLWATERKDVLAGVFGFLALYWYVGWVVRRGRGRYALMAAAYACSLLAKPTLFMTLPVLLLLLDYWPLRRLGNRRELHARIDEKWALWLLTVGLAGLSVYTQQGMGSVLTLDDLPVEVRFQTVMVSYLRYLWLHVACTRLGAWYPYPPPPGMLVGSGAMLMLAGITWVCWRARGRRPWLWVGWCWYVLAFVHLIGIVQTGLQGWADRFTYVPAVGLMLMAAYSVPDGWWKRVGWRTVWGAVAVVMMVLTMRQAHYWRDSFALFGRTLEVTGENGFVEGRLEAARRQRGFSDE